MTETEVDEADLVICDLIALLKSYGISVKCAVEMTTERMVELYPEIEPAPVIH